MPRQHIFRQIFEKIDISEHRLHKSKSAQRDKNAIQKVPKDDFEHKALHEENKHEQMLVNAVKSGELTRQEIESIPDYSSKSESKWAHIPYIDKVLQMREVIENKRWAEAGAYFVDKKKFNQSFAVAVTKMFDSCYVFELHPPHQQEPWAENLFDITVPHLLFSYNDGQQIYRFAVQTLWRSRFTKHGLSLMCRSQFIKCKLFEQETGIPVFMIFGVGGTSDSPERIFVYPIKDMPNVFIPKQIAYENEYSTITKFRYIPELQKLIQ